MDKKIWLIIDITRCNGCYNCFSPAVMNTAATDYPGYAAAQPYSGHFWMKVSEKERGQYPKVK